MLYKCYETAMQLLWNCYATALQLLCKRYVNAIQALCKYYGNSMQMLANAMQRLANTICHKSSINDYWTKKNLNGYWTKKISMTTERKLVDTNQRQKKNLAICRSVSWAMLTLKNSVLGPNFLKASWTMC